MTKFILIGGLLIMITGHIYATIKAFFDSPAKGIISLLGGSFALAFLYFKEDKIPLILIVFGFLTMILGTHIAEI